MDTAIEREVITRLYDAATGDCSWTPALESIGAGVGARTVVLFSQLPGTCQSSFLGGVGVTGEALQAYREYFGARNVLMQHGAVFHHPGIVRTSESICSAPTLLGSEYYHDFMRPNDLRYSIGITADRGDTHAVHLSAFRPRDRGEFGDDERQAFSTLYPHVRQAVRIAAQLEGMQGLKAALQTVGDQLGKGIALLDANGAVLHANTVFERICAARDGLTTSHGVLTPARPSATVFARLLAAVVLGNAGGSVDVLRPSGGPPYTLLVSPVRHTVSSIGAVMPRASVIVSDPALAHGPSEQTLQQRYGWTRAEARVVTQLVRGANVAATARHLGISLNTARTHLKRAMGKAGVSRQAELVRLLLGSL